MAVLRGARVDQVSPSILLHISIIKHHIINYGHVIIEARDLHANDGIFFFLNVVARAKD